MLQRQVDELADMVVVKPVIEDGSLPAVCHEVQMPQGPELMADGRFGDLQVRCDITDTHLPQLKGPQDLQPRRITHGFENACNTVDIIPSESVRSGPLNFLTMDDSALTKVAVQFQIPLPLYEYLFIYTKTSILSR
jgi:hypothetical protein